ncbi:hypothetical protein [Campylobacter sp. RM12647]|uniref:hypothetical protein n=1 Tax=Campylobacter sp. RM12647 TaxID=2735737 RepID=UPI001D23D4FD|nr:hypothetical protein [Campylobacter sp. RM12647]
MKYIVYLLLICSSLFAFSDDELFNQLPKNWDDEQKKEIVKYYKEYGKNYNNINDYANDTRNNFSKLYKQSEYLINDDNLYAHYELNDKHRVINSYINYLNDKTLKKENALDFNAFIFNKISRLESDLKSELQSYYAVLNASNIKNSWLNEYARDYNKALKMNSSYDEIVFNIFIKAHFNEYELSKNAKNEIIATDKALGLSANVGDIESFNYYTLKAFILNYLVSFLGLIVGVVLCVKYKHKALVYISPVLLFIIGLTIDYFVIGIKLLKYV